MFNCKLYHLTHQINQKKIMNLSMNKIQYGVHKKQFLCKFFGKINNKIHSEMIKKISFYLLHITKFSMIIKGIF